MVESVQSITLFPFKFSTFQFAVCKAYDNGQVIALDGDTKNSTYSLALRVLWLSKTLWAWPWVVLLGAVPSPSPARLQHSLHIPLITWEWQQFPRPQLTSVDLIVVFQLVCCFLNEFNIGNIFLIKFVMGLLYPWVSSEVSRICYSTIHATFCWNTCHFTLSPVLVHVIMHLQINTNLNFGEEEKKCMYTQGKVR